MKIVICGAGQVGGNLAAFLSSEGNDVTVVDQDPAIIHELNQTQDVRGIVGHASHPDVLEKAGLKTADMIIASTQSDEVNMVTCQIAHTLFNVPKKIARIRAQIYRDPVWGSLFSREHMPIDVVISPENEVARAITERLSVPGAFNVMTFEDDKARIIGVVCDQECSILNTPFQQLETLFPDLKLKIVCIIRDGRAFIPQLDDQIYQGDEVYFVTETDQTTRAMTLFGHETPEARNIVIVGGGNIGLCLSRMIYENHQNTRLKVIEYNAERALELNELLPQTVVLKGDALQPSMLNEANIAKAEALITVTNDDETNILCGLLGKKYGAKRSISLVNKTTYTPIISNIGLDAVVSPRSITVATILQYVRRGKIKAVRRLREEIVEILEIEATESSHVVNIPIKDLNLPMATTIAAIFHKGEFFIPSQYDEIKTGDKVIIVTLQDCVQEIEDLFTPRGDLF